MSKSDKKKTNGGGAAGEAAGGSAQRLGPPVDCLIGDPEALSLEGNVRGDLPVDPKDPETAATLEGLAGQEPQAIEPVTVWRVGDAPLVLAPGALFYVGDADVRCISGRTRRYDAMHGKPKRPLHALIHTWDKWPTPAEAKRSSIVAQNGKNMHFGHIVEYIRENHHPEAKGKKQRAELGAAEGRDLSQAACAAELSLPQTTYERYMRIARLPALWVEYAIAHNLQIAEALGDRLGVLKCDTDERLAAREQLWGILRDKGRLPDPDKMPAVFRTEEEDKKEQEAKEQRRLQKEQEAKEAAAKRAQKEQEKLKALAEAERKAQEGQALADAAAARATAEAAEAAQQKAAADAREAALKKQLIDGSKDLDAQAIKTLRKGVSEAAAAAKDVARVEREKADAAVRAAAAAKKAKDDADAAAAAKKAADDAAAARAAAAAQKTADDAAAAAKKEEAAAADAAERERIFPWDPAMSPCVGRPADDYAAAAKARLYARALPIAEREKLGLDGLSDRTYALVCLVPDVCRDLMADTATIVDAAQRMGSADQGVGAWAKAILEAVDAWETDPDRPR